MGDIEQLEDEIAVIKEVNDDEVLLQVERKGACKSCGLNMLCMGRENRVEFRLKKTIPLKPGDRVRLEIKPASRMISSFLIFIFPILNMVLFFVLARYLFRFSENAAIFISLAGLLFSGVVIKIVDNKYADKISVVIVEKLENENSLE
jgi:sigma-E factor negative regulatory protein RseC